MTEEIYTRLYGKSFRVFRELFKDYSPDDYPLFFVGEFASFDDFCLSLMDSQESLDLEKLKMVVSEGFVYSEGFVFTNLLTRKLS